MQNIQKCVQVQRQCAKYKSDHNPLAQYSRQNNVILSGIPDSVFFSLSNNFNVLQTSATNKLKMKI